MLSPVSSYQSYGYQFSANAIGASSQKNAPENSVDQNPGGNVSTNSNKQEQLTPDQLQALEKLKARDREVRAHEQAHLSAAGGLATGGASFTYQSGPDGNRYAIGGEVNIDTSSTPGDPEATIRKAETIRRAALAPAEPSGQDRQVAAATASMIAKAQIELQQSKANEFTQNKTIKPKLGLNIDYSV